MITAEEVMMTEQEMIDEWLSKNSPTQVDNYDEEEALIFRDTLRFGKNGKLQGRRPTAKQAQRVLNKLRKELRNDS